jgi:antitoxin FitA
VYRGPVTTKTIQVRNVPADVHRVLAERAARQHRSLSDVVLEEIARFAREPTMEEWLAQVRALEPIGLAPGEAARVVRAGRPDEDDV